MNSSSLVKSFGFRLVESFGVQFIQLLITIILARLLVPENYGIVAIASSLISILTSIVQSSFNTPLVQKKELSDLDASSSFYMMLAISVLLYIVLFFLAPAISRLYDMPDLKNVIRVLSVVLVIGSWNSVQMAFVYRNFRFKQSMVISFSAMTIQGFTGIALAYCGYGVWSLVWSQIIYNVLISVLYVKCNHWFPKPKFSWNSICCIWRLGLPLLGAELISIASSNINPMIIGLKYDSGDLGAYQKGLSIPSAVINGTVSACNTVFLPALSRLQDDFEKLKLMLQSGIGISCYLIVPLAFGLCAISRNFVIVVLGMQWCGSIPFMQISSVIFSFYPLRIKLQAIKALGKPKHSLLINLIYSLVSLVLLFLSVFISLKCVLFSLLISELVYGVTTALFIKLDLNYNLLEQVSDIFPAYFFSFLMVVLIYIFEKVFPFQSLLFLIIKVFIGILFYLFLSLTFCPAPVKIILSKLHSFIESKKRGV